MISVIISVYNVAPYLERCIASILNQTYSDLEVIAVDDGSTDESGEICDRIALEDSRMVVVHKENGGNASARNAGIDVAKGEFLTFVDADDYIEETMYEEMLAEIKDPSISIVSCGIIFTDVDGRDSILKAEKKKLYDKEEALMDYFARIGNVGPAAWNKLYRREVFAKGARFKNGVIHEDTEAMPRFLDASERICVLDQAFYHYIKRNNSASTSKKFNMRGYHILDSMKDYKEMCREKYPQILPYVYYFELMTTYEMLLNLASCGDYEKYKKEERAMRCKLLKLLLQCGKMKGIRREHSLWLILLRAILGIRTEKLLVKIRNYK